MIPGSVYEHLNSMLRQKNNVSPYTIVSIPFSQTLKFGFMMIIIAKHRVDGTIINVTVKTKKLLSLPQTLPELGLKLTSLRLPK
jgi:hypothetical protein